MKQEIITNLKVNNNTIRVMIINNNEYISLTDLARYQNSTDPSFTVKNWLRKITTINYWVYGRR